MPFAQSLALPTTLFRQQTPAWSRRRYLLMGAAAGVLTGAITRVWMRTITSQEPVFSIGGTVFILLAFGGMGAIAALALYRRQTDRDGKRTRLLAFLPFAFLGPFTLFFLPGLLAAVVIGRPWRRWIRLPLWISGAFVLAFVLLILAGEGEMYGPPWARVLLYLCVGYASFATNRIAFAPRPSGAQPAESAPQWDPLP